ncbi:LytTR family two component transcriptional regulator [Herbihabitans rhizosphaerae]|uniref:LytTR family two component transcriptional regulator n=1 Tax=Herbihabitans rhizosphaerae TaxID=1872711 RepID=A0A4Q7KMG1_9PSEU|nr:LytTR family DNA-binding domain-containing protein [Herbihabitans rhizosphaerae]RZS37457.1 LytTR family two component transcriptional regulator [Herbihabitans rhizosphaerae]
MHITVSTAHSTRGLVVLAVDDEEAGITILRERLDGNPHVRRIIEAFDASEALRVLSGADEELAERKQRGLPVVDAVFADLNMPGLTGMEMARVLLGFNPPPVLVFITGHGAGKEGQDALSAFELGAVDYILKPCDQDRMDSAIERVLSKIKGDGIVPGGGGPAQESGGGAHESTDEEVIPVELAGNTKLIPRASVRWVEAQGDYARLFTLDGSHLVRIPLSQLEERWGKAGFVRIHRSYLVPIKLITELQMTSQGYKVVIGHEEKTLPVSRRHTRELKERLVKAPRNGLSP